MITIRVPATSANLGSGFDTLGVALNLYATFTFEKQESGLRIEGCNPDYANEENLVYRSFKRAFELQHTPVCGLHLTIDSLIPLARGLGSSATCIVAGVMAANYFLQNPYTKEELFQIASQIEGHPDNIAPCMFGGFQASTAHQKQWIHTAFAYDTNLHFYALVPDFELSTTESRTVLPKQIDYKQAVSNLSKLAFVIKGIEQANENYLSAGFDDVLHQPYRFPLIQHSDAILSYCQKMKYPVYLSGAGPTIMIVTKQEIVFNDIPATWKLLPLSIAKKGANIYE